MSHEEKTITDLNLIEEILDFEGNWSFDEDSGVILGEWGNVYFYESDYHGEEGVSDLNIISLTF